MNGNLLPINFAFVMNAGQTFLLLKEAALVCFTNGTAFLTTLLITDDDHQPLQG